MSSTLVRVGSRPLISPHPLALLYGPEKSKQNAPSDMELMANAVELANGNLQNLNAKDRELLRQTGLVSLWFFLKYVAGYTGPYESLNAELHVDMCNFYQLVRRPKVKAFGCAPRGVYKSSCWGHGGNTWDILRDPEEEIILASNIFKRSLEFIGYSTETFRDNDFFAFLYPEWALPAGRSKNVNDEQLMIPLKKRNTNKPNISVVSIGGSIQGVHGSLKIDDPIGEHMLDAGHHLGVDAVKAANWVKAAVENIPRGSKNKFIFLTGTRYGPEDGYEVAWDSIKDFYGFTEGEPYEIKTDGEWIVYYRCVREDHGDGLGEQPIMPEEYTNEKLDKIMQEDPWEYYTQLMNMSTFSGLNEMIELKANDCTLDIDDDGQYVITYFDRGELQTEYLSDMDLVTAHDPAGSDKRTNSRTSRSASIDLARNSEDKFFLVKARAGYVAFSKQMDWMFQSRKQWKGNLRQTVLEAQGPFKAFVGVVRDEEQRRIADHTGEFLNLRPVPAVGEKVARIRAVIEPILKDNRLYATKEAMAELERELKVFPNSSKMDILDALTIGILATVKPPDPEDGYDEELELMVAGISHNRTTGY